jgi:hypothetical protein
MTSTIFRKDFAEVRDFLSKLLHEKRHTDLNCWIENHEEESPSEGGGGSLTPSSKQVKNTIKNSKFTYTVFVKARTQIF